MKKVIKLEVGEWGKIVEKEYGKTYSFQQQDGCKDRGVFEFSIPSGEGDEYKGIKDVRKINPYECTMGVDFNIWKSTEQKDKEWQTVLHWERYFYPSVFAVANDLFEKGLLEEGDYIINIDW